MVFSRFFTLPSDRREANNEDGRYGVFGVFAACCIDLAWFLWQSVRYDFRNYSNREKNTYVKNKKCLATMKDNFRETDLGWLAD